MDTCLDSVDNIMKTLRWFTRRMKETANNKSKISFQFYFILSEFYPLPSTFTVPPSDNSNLLNHSD